MTTVFSSQSTLSALRNRTCGFTARLRHDAIYILEVSASIDTGCGVPESMTFTDTPSIACKWSNTLMLCDFMLASRTTFFFSCFSFLFVFVCVLRFNFLCALVKVQT